MASDTERRMAFLSAYADWIAGDDGILPEQLEEAMNLANLNFAQQVAAMDDLAQAIQSYVKSVREAEKKAFHRETPVKQLILLTMNKDEIFVVSHLMSLGVLAMGMDGKNLPIAIRQARKGLATLGTEGAVSLFDRVNKLTIASFPEAQVIELHKGDL